MPRNVPAYRLHRPSGKAVVTLNGRDFYLGPHGSQESRAAYDRLISEWLSHGRQLPTIVPQGQLSVSELFVAYLNFAREYYSRDGEPTSEYRDMRTVLKDVERLYGSLPVNQFGPMALKAVRQTWIERRFVRRRINQLVNRVRRTFKWGIENELVPADVLNALKAVAPLRKGRSSVPESAPRRAVDDALVDATLPHCSRQVAAMIQLQRFSGMRPGEVVRLRPCEVDQSAETWIYRPARHKTDYRDHVREVFFGPKAQDILRPFLDRDPDAFCFSPIEAEAERNAARRVARKTKMSPSQSRRKPKANATRAKRQRYDRESYYRAVKYAIQKAARAHVPIADWTPAQLRHLCGTRVRRAYGLDAAQVILGHRCAEITEVYAATDRRVGSEIMQSMG